MSTKTPLPRSNMTLRVLQKESQRHPGKPDLPQPKRPTSVVQAEKAEKARIQSEREDIQALNIQKTTNLETQMKEDLREKLEMAHHPKPPATSPKKVLHLRPRVTKGGISKILISKELHVDNIPR